MKLQERLDAHYGAAKAALNNWSEALAKELAPIGVRVNVVTPGPIVTGRTL